MFTFASRPENELLLRISRRSLNDSTSERIRTLLRCGDLDWDYLLSAAVAHGVGGLLAHHVLFVGSELIPSPVLLELQRRTQHYAEQYMFLTGQLVKIFSTLHDRGIRCVTFKGPTLALMAYGDLGLRQFADLDLMVNKNDVSRVKELLMKEGFLPFMALDPGREAALLRFDNAYSFVNSDQVFIDVHWRFAPLYSSLLPETEAFWERIEPLEIGNQRVMTLSAEDLLLVLCCHGFTHNWERLVWICDVASLIERRNLDWDYVFRQAKQLGVLRIVLVGLALAEELGASLTAEVREKLEADRVVRTYAREIARQLLEPLKEERGLLQWLARQLSIRERVRDKVRVLFHLIFTPRQYDWAFASVPPSVSFVYYCIRPIRMTQTRLSGKERDKPQRHQNP